MGFLQRLSLRIRRFMQGRYGSDNLSYFLLGLALLLWLIHTFLGRRIIILTILVLVLLLLCNFRMFSKNIQARYQENMKYLSVKNRLLGFLRGKKSPSGPSAGRSQASGDPERKIFSCPACKQKVRVPRGKGKIEITCPKCGNHFKRRT